jgi:hypothetical protein
MLNTALNVEYGVGDVAEGVPPVWLPKRAEKKTSARRG